MSGRVTSSFSGDKSSILAKRAMQKRKNRLFVRNTRAWVWRVCNAYRTGTVALYRFVRYESRGTPSKQEWRWRRVSPWRVSYFSHYILRAERIVRVGAPKGEFTLWRSRQQKGGSQSELAPWWKSRNCRLPDHQRKFWLASVFLLSCQGVIPSNTSWRDIRLIDRILARVPTALSSLTWRYDDPDETSLHLQRSLFAAMPACKIKRDAWSVR